MNTDLKEELEVLVELVLYKELVGLKEMGYPKSELKKAITKFIKELPEQHRDLPDRDEIIKKVLNRMQMNVTLPKSKETNEHVGEER